MKNLVILDYYLPCLEITIRSITRTITKTITKTITRTITKIIIKNYKI